MAQFLELWNQRVEERRAFRLANLNVNYESFEKLVKGKKLDSNLKKCTAFVRKMVCFDEHIIKDSLNIKAVYTKMSVLLLLETICRVPKDFH